MHLYCAINKNENASWFKNFKKNKDDKRPVEVLLAMISESFPLMKFNNDISICP